MSRGKASVLMLLTAAATAVLLISWPRQQPVQLRTVVVQPGNLIQSVQVSGVVSYAQMQPCISLKDAKVAAVHVRAGQHVERGDLLFSLDTTAEEQALAALYQAAYEKEEAFPDAEAAAAALANSFAAEWMERELALRKAIESASIRADFAGVVEAVYAKEGDCIPAKSALGLVRGTEKCIVATGTSAIWNGLYPGAAALVSCPGKAAETVMLQSLQAPVDAQQSAVFCWQESTALQPGQHVTLEMITRQMPAEALVPLSAIDQERRVWYVEEGSIRCAQVNPALRNAEYAALGVEWAGRRVILFPEKEALRTGMRTEEAVDL